jgi:molybdopterin/thiamine biosynthesis adenylyltransferase
MNTRNYSHQEGLFNPAHSGKVILIGTGSVGSFVAYFLDKMGVSELEVWDADSVASHNCSMSWYEPEDVGFYKVDVLARKLRSIKVIPHRKMYEGEELTGAVVVCCVDKMSVRKIIWDRVKMITSIPMFCDTRVAKWYAEVLTLNPCDHEHIADYEKLGFSDEDAVPQACGYHGVLPVSVRTAQVVVSDLVTFWRGERPIWRFGERCDIHRRAF